MEFAWVMMWSLRRYYKIRNFDALWHRKSVGATSGGNWFITDTIYDANVSKSFDTFHKDAFLELLSKRQQKIIDDLELRKDTARGVCSTLEGLSYVLRDYCQFAPQYVFQEQGWKKFMER